jgi:hypothetical protein
MKSLTIHGIDDPLDQELKRKSRELGVSLNKTIKRLLADHLHIGTAKTADHRRDFADFCGVWTTRELKEFREKIKRTELVDPGDWA